MDDETLGCGVDGVDGVGVVESVEEEGVGGGVAVDIVGGVVAGWGSA